MPSRDVFPAAPLAAGVQVRAPGNRTFGKHIGIIQPMWMSANYRRVVFPGHPWQTDGITWAFRIDELVIVGKSNVKRE